MIKLKDLPADVVLKSLKEEIKKNKEHDKYGIATVILVSIYNTLSDAYIKAVEDLKEKTIEVKKNA